MRFCISKHQDLDICLLNHHHRFILRSSYNIFISFPHRKQLMISQICTIFLERNIQSVKPLHFAKYLVVNLENSVQFDSLFVRYRLMDSLSNQAMLWWSRLTFSSLSIHWLFQLLEFIKSIFFNTGKRVIHNAIQTEALPAFPRTDAPAFYAMGAFSRLKHHKFKIRVILFRISLACSCSSQDGIFLLFLQV